MKHIYLVKHDTEKKQTSFLSAICYPGLFEEWLLVKERGRVDVGKTGNKRKALNGSWLSGCRTYQQYLV
jgi:hypothetical protein